MLLHNPGLGNFKRIEIIDSVFSDLNRNNSERNNREMPGKMHKHWKVSNCPITYESKKKSQRKF